MTTKRSIEKRIEHLEEGLAIEKDRLELLVGPGLWYGPEPELTNLLISRGFVVEREDQVHKKRHQHVQLHTIPSAFNVFQSILWHYDGPTAAQDDVRVMWEDAHREQVVSNATYPVEYSDPDLPDNPIVVDEGDGWMAVAPADRVVENMVLRRSAAEQYGYEIRDPVPSWIDDADEYDLVEVDADPVPYGDRRRRRRKRGGNE